MFPLQDLDKANFFVSNFICKIKMLLLLYENVKNIIVSAYAEFVECPHINISHKYNGIELKENDLLAYQSLFVSCYIITF